jgi:hypothetical protein
VRLAIAFGVLTVAAVVPGVASAHLGRTLPVATNFTARITGSVRGLAAKVVDGDQTLWLRAPAAATMAIPGTLGEPLLRFDARGVWVNLRSPTAQVDGIDRPDLRAPGPPLWHRLSHGHEYRWHEHRLHALEPLAHEAGAVGPWSVPVVVDGRRSTIHGVLDYRPPGRVWAWIAGSIVLAVASAVSATRSTAALTALGLAAVAATWTVRLGRELYGRPDIPVTGWIGIELTCAIGAALLFGLTRRDGDARAFTAFFAGVGALYVGLTMLPLLTHAVALSALPSSLARSLEVVVIGSGVGTLLGSVFGHMERAQ